MDAKKLVKLITSGAICVVALERIAHYYSNLKQIIIKK